MIEIKGNLKSFIISNKLRITFYVLFLILIILSISIGARDFSLLGLFRGQSDEVFLLIISRIPRTFSIILTGASLSIAGLIMQTITNNKFVSPTTAGTMQWCKLGVAIAIILFGGQAKMMKVCIAFLIALLGTWLFMGLLQSIKFKSALMVPLIGIMMGSVVNSITSFMTYKHDIIQEVSMWLQGNFSLVIKGNYEILYLGIPFFIIAFFYANKFTIVSMGEEFSTNLGLNHKHIVLIGLMIVAFITSLVVVTIGSIQYIGLIIPNIVSMYKGDNIKSSLFDTAFLGAFFVMLCDIIGRTLIHPYELSVNLIASILGSIIFLIIIFRKQK